MKRTTIFLDEMLLRRVKRAARAEGRSFAAVVREALTQYVAQGAPRGGRLPSIAGAFDSGFTDTAERAEELLADLARRRGDERPG